MTDTTKRLTWPQFGIGIVGFVAILGLFDFLTNTDKVDATTRMLGAVGLGIGGLAGAFFFGFVLWGILRLIKGATGAPDAKFFLLATACVIGVGYIALNFMKGAP